MTYNYLLGLWGEKGGGLAIDVSSGPVFLSKKRRIVMDVSSGLIFLTHTKKKPLPEKYICYTLRKKPNIYYGIQTTTLLI